MRYDLAPSLRGVAALACVTGALTSTPATAATVDAVRERGALVCGVSEGLFGFSERKADGAWVGFDVDICRAIAAAVLGDPAKVVFVPLSASERFGALRDGKIDVLSRNSTWTLEREARLGLLFAGVNFHDGQGFMVHRDLNATSALELNDGNVCVQAGTTSQALVGDYFSANSMPVTVRTYPDAASTLRAFEGRDCNVMTTDNSGLFAERLKLAQPGDAVILPDIISKEPLGPVTRADDVPWHNIVKWVNFALINAEELGISSTNIPEAQRSVKPEVRRFVGADGDLGPMLGLPTEWALRAPRHPARTQSAMEPGRYPFRSAGPVSGPLQPGAHALPLKSHVRSRCNLCRKDNLGHQEQIADSRPEWLGDAVGTAFAAKTACIRVAPASDAARAVWRGRPGIDNCGRQDHANALLTPPRTL